MERPVEVAVFHRGEMQSLRILSPRQERRLAAVAAASTAAVVLAAMIATAGLLSSAGRIAHAPIFFLCWLGVAVGVAMVAARRARQRSRRYTLGVSIEADSFGATEVDLVRRVGRRDDYDLGLVPGMSGAFELGRSPLPIETLTRNGAVRVPLPPDAKVCIEYGPATFVIRRRNEVIEPPVGVVERARRGLAAARRFVPLAGGAVPLAALATFLGTVPAAMAVSDKDMASSIPSWATPAEIEQHIRRGAQRQARALHQCFDPLPLTCQRPGYVGVGVSLSKNGEVRAHWVSRSTYDRECPVKECMSNVVAGWYFEPMPEAMRIIIPIQVRRTTKPLYDPRPVIARPLIMADPQSDAGAFEVTATGD